MPIFQAQTSHISLQPDECKACEFQKSHPAEPGIKAPIFGIRWEMSGHHEKAQAFREHLATSDRDEEQRGNREEWFWSSWFRHLKDIGAIPWDKFSILIAEGVPTEKTRIGEFHI